MAVAAFAPAILLAACASDPPEADQSSVPSVSATTEDVARHSATTIVQAAAAPSATTESVPNTAPPTSAVTDIEGGLEDASDLATVIDFSYDYDDPDSEEPPDFVVGRDIVSGLWQWSRLSASSCVFIAVSPEPWSSGPGEPQRPIYLNDIERLWWLDTRHPVALAVGETVVGYSSSASIDEMVSATSHPECFLERVGANSVAGDELFAQRHDSGSGGIVGGEDIATVEPDSQAPSDGDTSWRCKAHDGPEPADLLDWLDERGAPQPEVSCVVGEGILAGWWQWHELSATKCIYVAVDSGNKIDQYSHRSQSRRDATEPILLRAGEIVNGYSDTAGTDSSFIAGTSHPNCFLEHIAPENEASA